MASDDEDLPVYAWQGRSAALRPVNGPAAAHAPAPPRSAGPQMHAVDTIDLTLDDSEDDADVRAQRSAKRRRGETTAQVRPGVLLASQRTPDALPCSLTPQLHRQASPAGLPRAPPRGCGGEPLPRSAGHAPGGEALFSPSLDVPLAQRLGERGTRLAMLDTAASPKPLPKPVVLRVDDHGDADDDDLPPGLSLLAKGQPQGGPTHNGTSSALPGGARMSSGQHNGGAAAVPAAGARPGETRAEAAALRKAAKAAEKVEKAAVREAHRSATGKHAMQEITVFIDNRLASTPLGRAIGTALHAKKFAHTVTPLPIEHTVCWVRHSPREDAWPGPFPWADAAGASSAGAQAIAYVLLALEPSAVTSIVTAGGDQETGGLESLVGRVRQAHAGATLCVCTVGLDHYLRAREQREFSTANPTGGFRRAVVDSAMARLVTHLRGVRQRDAKDVEQAAEHTALLTEALAKQPYRGEESFLVLFSGEKKAPKAAPGAGASQAGASQQQLDDDADIDGQTQPTAAAGGGGAMSSTASAWVAALASIPGCSHDSAAAVARIYPSPVALITAYRAPGRTETQAKALLKEIAVGSAASAKARRLGPACSERIWNLFRPRLPGDEGDEHA
jgi:hypothetical protein